MANGSPVSALLGKREIMRILEDVFFSCTFGGETLGLATCKATIETMVNKNVLDYLWKIGKLLQDGLLERISHYGLSDIVVPKGYPVRTVLQFYSPENTKQTDMNIKSLFQQEVLKRGMLLHEYYALSFSHSIEDIEYILETYDAALGVLKDAIELGCVNDKLEGKPVRSVLRRTD